MGQELGKDPSSWESHSSDCGYVNIALARLRELHSADVCLIQLDDDELKNIGRCLFVSVGQ